MIGQVLYSNFQIFYVIPYIHFLSLVELERWLAEMRCFPHQHWRQHSSTQDTPRQGYSPDSSSRGQKGLGSRLGSWVVCPSNRCMSVAYPTSRGQIHNQEAAVQWAFCLEKSSFFYSFSTESKDSIQCLLACILHTAVPSADPDSCPLKVKLRLMKTIGWSSNFLVLPLHKLEMQICGRSSMYTAFTLLEDLGGLDTVLSTQQF